MSKNQSIKKLISEIKSELENTYPIEEIEGFIKLIFEYYCNYSSTDLLVNSEKEICNNLQTNINQVILALKKHRPIQYILGETEFYDLFFKVSPSVLIPRQETEELVDLIIKENHYDSLCILDIGTGSGCIAISLAKNIFGSTLFAIDVSNEALSIAKENATLNNAEVSFFQKDVLSLNEKLEQKFDIIVSNPPYVTNSEKHLMQSNVLDYEPHLALFVSDYDPLIFYKAIVNFSIDHLNTRGKLYFEINESFGSETADLLLNAGFKSVMIIKDLNGKDRIVRGELNR